MASCAAYEPDVVALMARDVEQRIVNSLLQDGEECFDQVWW